MPPITPPALRASRSPWEHKDRTQTDIKDSDCSPLSVKVTLPVFYSALLTFALHLQVWNSVPVEQVGFDVLSHLFPVLIRSSLEYLSLTRRIFLI